MADTERSHINSVMREALDLASSALMTMESSLQMVRAAQPYASDDADRIAMESLASDVAEVLEIFETSLLLYGLRVRRKTTVKDGRGRAA